MSEQNRLQDEIVHPETSLCTLEAPQKVLKRQFGLGRLNRLIASSTALIVAKGHVNKRFKRDYASSVAFYQCPDCQAVAAVGLGNGRGVVHTTGDAFETVCNKQTK